MSSAAPAQAPVVKVPYERYLGSYAAGAAFGAPNVTRFLEQPELNDGYVATMNQSTTAPITFPSSFLRTDLIEAWEMEFSLTQSITGSPTASPMFPYSALGPFRLSYQNQFDAISVDYGFDLKLFEQLRPPRYGAPDDVWQQSPATNAYNAQSNLVTASNYTSSSSPMLFSYYLPTGLEMDAYYELEEDGRWATLQQGNKVLGPVPPRRGFISPLMMSGVAREIVPRVTLNPYIGSQTQSALYTGGSSPTASGANTFGFRRRGYYQPVGPSDTPVGSRWQYVLEAKQYTMGAVTFFRQPIQYAGQLFGIFLRLYDPAASSSVGAPIALSNVTRAQLKYGSGLWRFDDAPREAQRRLIQQRRVLPGGEGVIFWDILRLNDNRRVNGGNVLNTINTSDVHIELNFSSTLSSSAILIIGVEGFKLVS